jgi:hypothetical protein
MKNPVGILFVRSLLVLVSLIFRAALQADASAASAGSLPPNSVVWVEDTLPDGATPGSDGGDAWNWVSSNPLPFSGAAAQQSINVMGLHQVFFSGATAPFAVSTGDVLFAYIYLDPSHPPTEAMLQWTDGSWEHRAFWGANNISYGIFGGPSRFYAGALPSAGGWARLEVRASQVGLEGSHLTGMAFTLFDGRATWDAAGKTAGSGGPPPPADTTPPVVTLIAPENNTIVSGASVPVSASATDNVAVAGVQFKIDGANLGSEKIAPPFTITLDTTLLLNGIHNLGAIARDAASNRSTSSVDIVVANLVVPPNTNLDVVWVEDDVPTGAVTGSDGGDDWNWISSDPLPFTGTAAHQSALATGSHQHWFNFAWTTLAVNTGEVLVAYVYLDPVNPPSEIMLQWNDSSWEHRAYWGANLDTYGVDGTVSRRSMGLLPPKGQWSRLEVPANIVGLEGSTLKGMSFSAFNGSATWDHVGKRTSPKLSIQRDEFGEMSLTWPSTSGQTYRVLFKTDLGAATWDEISGPITATDSTTTWFDIDADIDVQRFYQIVQ